MSKGQQEHILYAVGVISYRQNSPDNSSNRDRQCSLLWEPDLSGDSKAGYRPINRAPTLARDTAGLVFQINALGVWLFVGMLPQGVGRGCMGLMPQQHTHNPDLH